MLPVAHRNFCGPWTERNQQAPAGSRGGVSWAGGAVRRRASAVARRRSFSSSTDMDRESFRGRRRAIPGSGKKMRRRRESRWLDVPLWPACAGGHRIPGPRAWQGQLPIEEYWPQGCIGPYKPRSARLTEETTTVRGVGQCVRCVRPRYQYWRSATLLRAVDWNRPIRRAGWRRRKARRRPTDWP